MQGRNVMSESKNDPKKNGPAELSARYDQKYTIQRHTIINTLSAIVLSRQPIFFSVALRVFLELRNCQQRASNDAFECILDAR